MSSSKYSEQEVTARLREIWLRTNDGASIGAACRAVGINELTYYRWVRRYSKEPEGTNVLEELREENRRLRLIVADQAEHIRMLAAEGAAQDTPGPTRRRTSSSVGRMHRS